MRHPVTRRKRSRSTTEAYALSCSTPPRPGPRETSFEQGDKIGLYLTEYTGETPAPLQISGNWANNVAATLDGADWVTAKKIFWERQSYGRLRLLSLHESGFH